MVDPVDCGGAERNVNKEMNEEFSTDPKRALQTTPVVYLWEDSRAAASCNRNCVK